MVHLARKKRNGVSYLYLEERAWIDGRSKRVWQKYLGREDKISEMTITLSPTELNYKSMNFGCSAALYQLAQKLDLIELINSNTGKKRNQKLTIGEYFLIATINRCVSPQTKNKIGDWFKDDYLSTIFDIDHSILNSQTYWNHFQYLGEEEISLIEEKLIKKTLQIYPLDLSCLMFDPTNFFTFISEHETSDLPQFGHSKENRNNLRIINVSLLCTREFGIPIFHQTYEGNIQDAKHFREAIKSMFKRFQQIGQQVEEIVLLFDKGNHSLDAFKEINEANVPFIASLRNSTQKELLDIDKSAFTMTHLPSNGKAIGYYRTVKNIYEKERTVYVLYDPRKEIRTKNKFEIKLQKKVDSINDLLSKLNVKKWRSKDNVEKKLNSLIGRNPFNQIISYTITGSYAELEVVIQQNTLAKDTYFKHFGRSVIFTTLDQWQPEKVIQAFRDKYVVEDSFKKLKNPKFLTIRPMFHWNDNCIRAHVFSCVLGLFLLSLLRFELSQKKVSVSFDQLHQSLAEMSLTKISIPSKNSLFYKLNTISPLSEKIYKKLQLKKLLPK